MELLFTIGASTIVLLVAGIFVWLRWRPREESFLVFRCPRCDQKLRYLASKAGRRGMCTRCGRNSVLPTEAAASTDTASGYRPQRSSISPTSRFTPSVAS